MDAVYTAPGYLFRRMQQIAVAIFVEECKAHDLTPVQYASLVSIRTHPGIDATRLSAVIAFDRSTLGSVIERLEAKAYIERKPSPGDKRTKLLYLTRSGAALLRDIIPSVERAQARMLQPLKPADRKTLLELLTQLVDLNNEASRVPLRAEDALEHLGQIRLMAPAADKRPVLIAGGGIGGLAAALGLAQKGIASILLEKASALGEIGAGIQLGPNAFHAFDYLGVGEAARGMAVYIDQLRLMDALTSEEITHVDLGDAFRARFGNPYAVVHRGDLHGVFLKACQDHATDRVARQLRGGRLRPGRRVGDGAARVRRARDGVAADRRRRAVVEHPQIGRRRRSAAGVRPLHLSLGDPDRGDAGGSALERGDAVGGAEMPHRALPAVGLEGVQPRRHLSQPRAGAGRGPGRLRTTR